MNITTIYKKFPTKESCIEHMEKVRWDGKPECPYCVSKRITKYKDGKRYHCNSCNTSFSVTVSTIFHDTKLDLQVWFVAISLVLNAKKGISSRQLARDLGVNPNTGWYMQVRIRKALQEYGELLSGIVEADETFMGGKNKNRHYNKKIKNAQGRSTKDKTPVIGVLERGGKVIAEKAKNTQSKTLKKFIKSKVEKGSTMMTDEWGGYNGLDKKGYDHERVDHGADKYVVGNAHTNTIEGFWSLLKRGMVGQYHHVTEKWLNSYIAEFCFRYNERKNEDVFELVLMKAVNINC